MGTGTGTGVAVVEVLGSFLKRGLWGLLELKQSVLFISILLSAQYRNYLHHGFAMDQSSGGSGLWTPFLCNCTPLALVSMMWLILSIFVCSFSFAAVPTVSLPAKIPPLV